MAFIQQPAQVVMVTTTSQGPSAWSTDMCDCCTDMGTCKSTKRLLFNSSDFRLQFTAADEASQLSWNYRYLWRGILYAPLRHEKALQHPCKAEYTFKYMYCRYTCLKYTAQKN
uniref:Uncharacterized protein n=1 Tax=Acanthochromis polyacanthus TaxID=80966 RepID=A0A3Q1EM89_9TELE